MSQFTQEELNLILEKHKKWLNYEKDGERADLTGVECGKGIHFFKTIEEAKEYKL